MSDRAGDTSAGFPGSAPGHRAAPPGAARGDTLLVVRKSFNALDFIDAGTGVRVATVDVGAAPHEVALSPDNRRAAVSNYGPPDRPGNTIRLIDVGAAAETAIVDVSPHGRPHGVAWISPSRIAVTTEMSRHLLIVDADERRIEAAIETGQDVSHMVVVSADGRRAYVANIKSGSMSAIDLAARRKIADVQTGSGSEGIALTGDGREVWVCVRAENRIAVVDTRSLETVASIPTPQMPIRVAMSPDGRTGYVTCAAASTLIAIDVASRTVSGRHRVELPLAPGAENRQFAHLGPGSPLPIGLAVSPQSGAIFLAATMADRVQVLDPAGLSTVLSVDIGGEPDGLAVLAATPRG